NDLNLKKEIFPLFDYCLNDISKYKLFDLLNFTLKNKEEIYARQIIIKGFIKNESNLENYTYSKIYFHQVHNFLTQASYDELDISKLDLIIFSKVKQEIQSKIIQFTSLFEKILNSFLKKINKTDFPTSYVKDLDYMIDFISFFEIDYYKSLNNYKIKDIISLSKKIKSKKNEFQKFYDILLKSEAYFSISQGCIFNKFTFPSFIDHDISIKDVYHPLLEKPVSNDVFFDKNVILLTGPNMSGKSTFLKSIFISIYLGHLGIAVPAKEANFPFFDYFSISINHQDDLKSGYSHFMNEIISLKKVLEKYHEGKRCFVIFDELFKGTNIEDAIAISSETIKGLLTYNASYFLISTHLHLLNNLNEIKENKTGNFYIESRIENNKPIFTYKLKDGWSDLKIGQILFQNEGITSLLSK
ncbi:MutS-related protein, partial [Algoriella sp.]